jgi:Outer membrane protein beta-barrel domain
VHPRALLARLGSALLLTLIAATASAQSRFYVGGTAIADIRRFDSLELDPRILASLADISSRNGTAPGGGVRVGTFLHPRWSLELAVDAGSKTTSSFQNPVELLPIRSSTLRLPELSTSSSFSTISTVVGFHPERMGRVRLGYLGGMALVKGTYESTFPDFSYIPIELPFMRSLSSIPGLASLTQSIPTITGGTLRRTDNSVGGVIGLEAAIDLSDQLALVPGVRAVVFSSGGQNIFLTRPEVGVRWNF